MYSKHKTYSLDKALEALQKYCSYQDRCHMEVEQKLKSMGMIPQASNHIIMTLIQENYLNEERFAMAFVRGKFRIKKWGRIRLTAELKKRHISSYLIQKSLKQISDSEYLTTFEVLTIRKADTLTGSQTRHKKKQLINYLIYRGWEPHLIYEKVNQLF